MNAAKVTRSFRSPVSRLLRCHPFTWCAGLFAALALVLIIVPGEPRGAPHRDRLDWWEQRCQQVYETTGQISSGEQATSFRSLHLTTRLYEHGWPRPYLVRSIRVPVLGGYYSMRPRPLLSLGNGRTDCNGELKDFVLWSSYDNWPLGSIAWRLHPLNLAIDAILALLIAGTVGCATECWIRGRGGLLRFRVIDLLAATTVIALILGWHENHDRCRRVDRQVVEHFQSGKSELGPRMASYERYSGPDWLRRLLGHESLLPHCRHIYRVDLDGSKSKSGDVNELVKLPHLDEIVFHGPFPKSALRRLEDCPRLSTLFVDMYDPSGSENAARQANASDEMIGPADIGEIQLPQVRRLTLRGRVFLVDDIQRALAANRIEILDLYNVSVTVAELDRMRGRFVDTSIFINWPTQHGPPEGNGASVEQMKRRRACEPGLFAACDPRTR